MDIPPLAQTSQPPPKPVADLRPTADVAALVRDPRLAGATTSILPAPVGQIGEVSRSLIASSAGEAPTAIIQAERVLKPWGITMLPAAPEDEQAKAGVSQKEDVEEETG